MWLIWVDEEVVAILQMNYSLLKTTLPMNLVLIKDDFHPENNNIKNKKMDKGDVHIFKNKFS